MPGISRVTMWLLWLAVIGGCSTQPPAPAESTNSPAPPPENALLPEVAASFDLAQVKGFTSRVVVATGNPVADEAEPVESVTDWSLNQRGQLTVLVDKNSSSGMIEMDLFLIDGKQVDCLLRQRAKPPHSDREVRRFFGCELSEQGSVLVRIAQDTPPGWKLFLVDTKKLRPVPQTKPLPEDYFATESITGSQGHVAFVSREAGGSIKPDLFWSDGEHTVVCASAHNDPFDPRRRFRGFSRLQALNARGQLLFEASVQQDAASLIDNERLCLYTPAVVSGGEPVVENESPRGEVRELARQGEMLPGTDWTVARDRDCWSSAVLNDRGDVVFGQMESTGMGIVTRCVAVLRAGSSKWQIVLRTEQPLGQPPHNIQSMSFPSINARGQIACVVQVVKGQPYETEDQLVRIDPDAKLTVLARNGDQLGPGVILDGLGAPHILADGKVVYQAALRPAEFSAPREEALVIADGTRQRLIIREADLSVTGFQRPKFDQFQASDTGHVGVKVEGDAFEDAILLVTPDFSSPQGQRK